MAVIEERSWFWRKIGFWFCPGEIGETGTGGVGEGSKDIANRKKSADATPVCIFVGARAGV